MVNEHTFNHIKDAALKTAQIVTEMSEEYQRLGFSMENADEYARNISNLVFAKLSERTYAES